MSDRRYCDKRNVGNDWPRHVDFRCRDDRDGRKIQMRSSRRGRAKQRTPPRRRQFLRGKGEIHKVPFNHRNAHDAARKPYRKHQQKDQAMHHDTRGKRPPRLRRISELEQRTSLLPAKRSPAAWKIVTYRINRAATAGSDPYSNDQPGTIR
jgi:hypothetical protein